MKSFSLLNLLLLVAIVALTVSQLVMLRQLSDARREVDSVRRRFGYIKVDDEKMTYVSRIAGNEEPEVAYRIIVPAGSRYMLHLTDATLEGYGFLNELNPTKTISLNGWREGADVVLSFSNDWENNAPKIVVHTETAEYFNFVPSDWTASGAPGEGWHLQTDPQKAFAIDETIQLIWWKDSGTNRGIVLWLEPHSKWEAKLKAKKTTEPSM
jgi:hypothetical protein